MQLRPFVIGLLTLTCMATIGCRKQGSENPDPNNGGETPEQVEAPAAETPETKCASLLERFGEDVVESEIEACVEALTTGTELAVCRDAGAEKEYLSCFDSCMGSVDIDPAEYNPADSSTSPVVNCVAGCESTSCG